MCGRMKRSAQRESSDGRVSFSARIRTTQEVMDAVEWDAITANTSMSKIIGDILAQHYEDRKAQVHSHKVRRVPARRRV